MMPIGYEFGFRRKLDVVRTRPSDWEEQAFDLSSFVGEVNRMKASTASLNIEGDLRWSPPNGTEALALCRAANGKGSALIAVNTSIRDPQNVAANRLVALGAEPPAIEITPGRRGTSLMLRSILRLQPAEARVFQAGASATMDAPQRPRSRRTEKVENFDHTAGLSSRAIVIQEVDPEIDGGRFPIKRVVGDVLEVSATIFREGHDKIAAVVKFRRRGERVWRESRMSMVNPGLDRWSGQVRLERNARYEYTVEAWMDAYESWRWEVKKKREAAQDIALELIEGRALVAEGLVRAQGEDRQSISRMLAEFDAARDSEERAICLLSQKAQSLMARTPDRSAAVQYDRVLEVIVDRRAARYAAWYEMFHRSQGAVSGKSATFEDCAKRLPDIRNMGFDVVYFVPIHPIGRAHRKGPNNSLTAGPDDPGSPYAIGSSEGGHEAVHPDLGGIAGFRKFVEAARSLGLEVALDFAIQCSPDHPWIKEHPEWFKFRPDGSVKYAENPPKKYQDIVNVNFHGPERNALWRELRDVLLHWIDEGVTTFRVDNPHTKPVPFWEWLIRDIQQSHPEVVFLSEAFTRPPMLKMLAKVGFTQSYTYFTWRNFKHELVEYFTELTQSDAKQYLRPNLFTNTPDINPPYLQTGGRPAHQVRLVLAATLSSVYGIYNGFELCEAMPLPGKEEYLNSEKYEYKVWDWDRPGNIKDYITAVNAIRRENPALHELDNLRFYPSDDDDILFYGKMTSDRSNLVFVAVNLDPFEAHEAEISLPLHELGIPDQETFEVVELLSGGKHLWRGPRQRVRLDPTHAPANIFRVIPWQRVDYREPCF
jgi:starch synthase (maltosyl-transferring)